MSGTTLEVYENLFAVTQSDTVADPNGPFAGLVCSVAGVVKFTALGGQTNTITMVSGQHLKVATTRVWASVTAATVLGLSQPPYKPSFNPGTGVVLP